MNKIIYALLTLATLTSCANSYNIQGSSDVQMLDGRMLYLKVFKNSDLKNVDSCDVVHGKFQFTGTVDSTRMATLFMDDESIMPVVIERGEIVIKIDNSEQKSKRYTAERQAHRFPRGIQPAAEKDGRLRS